VLQARGFHTGLLSPDEERPWWSDETRVAQAFCHQRKKDLAFEPKTTPLELNQVARFAGKGKLHLQDFLHKA
jgi:hypothetical protein